MARRRLAVLSPRSTLGAARPSVASGLKPQLRIADANDLPATDGEAEGRHHEEGCRPQSHALVAYRTEAAVSARGTIHR